MNEPEIICDALLEHYALIADLPEGITKPSMEKRAGIRRAYNMCVPFSDRHSFKDIEEL